MAQEQSRILDMWRLDVRPRCVLRKLRIDTAEKLLSLTEKELLTLENCGPKTTAKILQLQAEYAKDLPLKKAQETIDEATASSMAFYNSLIVVAVFANNLIKSAKKSDRYYIYVTKQRFNALRQAVEALTKQRD